MARGTWPNDPKSTIVGTGIDWRAASPLAFNAPKTVWKRVQQQDALRLRDDPKYAPIFRTLPDDIQVIIHETCDPPDRVEEAKKQADATRESWLTAVDQAAREAEDADNIMAKLRALELRGKAIGVFDVPEQAEDTALAARLANARRRLHGPG